MEISQVKPKKWIVLVTRNRLTAVTDNCGALKRFSEGTNEHYGLVLQDNSDIKAPSFIVKYLEKYFSVIHAKTNSILSMSKNWNQGVDLALKQGAEYICVLSGNKCLPLVKMIINKNKIMKKEILKRFFLKFFL